MKIGDRVICVRDNWEPTEFLDLHNPKIGDKFTISGMCKENNQTYFTFYEIPQLDPNGEPEWFTSLAFRKLNDQDIATHEIAYTALEGDQYTVETDKILQPA